MPVTHNQLVSRTEKARPLSAYVPGLRLTSKIVTPDNQGSYTYTLTERQGAGYPAGFAPRYTPGEMLKLGVFSGKYVNDCTSEFPREWYTDALSHGKLSPESKDSTLNMFRVQSRKSLTYWREKGWIPLVPNDPDTRGWFMWYCRYWLGRRIPGLDELQIKRWKSFKRHAGQVAAAHPPSARSEKLLHRPKQRQALLQWSHDPWV
jgi:hypothetical protein